MSREGQNDRIEDYSGQHWDSRVVNEGIERRLRYTKPGANFELRTGTEELTYDRVRSISWGNVMEALERSGVLVKNAEGGYKKMAIGFGIDDQEHEGFVTRLGDVVNVDRDRTLEAFDVMTADGLRGFLKIKLSEKIKESHVHYKTPDFSALLDKLVDAFAKVIESRFRSDINRQIIYGQVHLELQRTASNCFMLNGVDMDASEYKKVAFGRMFEQWAGVLADVAHHSKYRPV